MRAESSWVSVTGACSAEGGIDGGTSLDLDPRVGLSVLFPRRDVREVCRPRVEDMAVLTEREFACSECGKSEVTAIERKSKLAVLARV